MRQAAESKGGNCCQRQDIPPERVEVALKAIQAETQEAARAALGEQAFGRYSQSATWIQKLGTN